jgi:hypothetical protein
MCKKDKNKLKRELVEAEKDSEEDFLDYEE